MISAVLPGTHKNLLKNLWELFNSLDKFTKLFIIAALLMVLITPITISINTVFNQHAASSAPSGEAMPVGDLPGWKQIFTDDFTTDVVLGAFSGCDPSTGTCSGLPASMKAKWWAYPDGWPDSSHNGTYMPSQVISVGSGVMDLNLHTLNGVHMVSAPVPKLPGAVGSGGGLQYGRYAILFKAEPVPGYKTAWLLWPDSDTWPRDGEVDFPEGNLNSKIDAFMHWQGGTEGNSQDAYSTNAVYTTWHTAVTEWTPTALTFYLDGQVIGKSTSRIPNTPMHWVIQTETALDGTVPSNNAVGNVQIDWVAVWAYSPGLVPTGPQTSTPTPTSKPTAAPTPTPKPTSAVVPKQATAPIISSGKILAQDTFASRRTTRGWGTASDGNSWKLQLGNSSSLSVRDGSAIIRGNQSSASIYLTLGNQNADNAGALMRFSTGSYKDDDGRILLRFSNINNYYTVGMASPNLYPELTIYKVKNGRKQNLISIPISVKNNNYYWEKAIVQTSGKSAIISVKFWRDNTAEPSSWNLTYIDNSPLPAGKVGVNGWDGGVSWKMDHFYAYRL